jgi:hypothetical protein
MNLLHFGVIEYSGERAFPKEMPKTEVIPNVPKVGVVRLEVFLLTLEKGRSLFGGSFDGLSFQERCRTLGVLGLRRKDSSLNR